MTPDEIREIVRRTRLEQGRPPKIDDPAALKQIAALLGPGRDESGPAGRSRQLRPTPETTPNAAMVRRGCDR